MRPQPPHPPLRAHHASPALVGTVPPCKLPLLAPTAAPRLGAPHRHTCALLEEDDGLGPTRVIKCWGCVGRRASTHSLGHKCLIKELFCSNPWVSSWNPSDFAAIPGSHYGTQLKKGAPVVPASKPAFMPAHAGPMGLARSALRTGRCLVTRAVRCRRHCRHWS